MKKFLSFFFLFSIWTTPCEAHLLEDLWNKYAPIATDHNEERLQTPGRILGKAQEEGTASFAYHWRYRWKTYELHFVSSSQLAHSIYGLALFTGDVSPNLPKDKFFGGVLGFHYSVNQICAWLNDVWAKHLTLTNEENFFVGLLLQDGVIAISKGGWSKTGKINHVLAAAPGKKRTFAENLRHERLHVFWDESSVFRAREIDAWRKLKASEQAEARKKLKNYSQNNESQLIEEWAVHRAEVSNMPLE